MVKFYAVIMVDTLEDDKDQSKECLGVHLDYAAAMDAINNSLEADAADGFLGRYYYTISEQEFQI